MAKKQPKITEEIVRNDMRIFLLNFQKERKVDDFLKDNSVMDLFLEMFQEGELFINEDGILVQELSDGQKFEFGIKRPKPKDLNAIKPRNYDSLDEERKALVSVSFITGKSFKELEENYFDSDLSFSRILCNFL